MMKARTIINLSKHIETVLLRSEKKDNFGYLYISDLLKEVQKHPLWEHIQEKEIFEVIDGLPVKRLEIVGNKIRMVKLARMPVTVPFNHSIIPPRKLVYGTTIVGISRVKNFGVKSFKDKMVKLYSDKRHVQVLMHKNTHLAYVELDALRAHEDGIIFYKGNFNTYLAEYIPPKYITNIT